MIEAKQILIFGLVGVATTAIDFAVFNLLTQRRVGWGRIPANLVSVAVAMAWSFLANWLIVFQPTGQDWLARAGKFLLTTLFSAFILQNAVLYLTTYRWRAPVNLARSLMHSLRLHRWVPDEVVARNTCKTLAVGAGFIWNFCWYKFFVYAN